MKPFNRRVLKRALWASASRLIGIVLGAGAESILYKLTGGGLQGWGLASLLSG
jgi:O-antigen/teichoic acid export membrane protein